MLFISFSVSFIEIFFYYFSEKFGLVNSLYVLLKGKSHPLDLFSSTNQKGTVYGFLSVTWGLLSDVDIESERYRFLGPLRFTIGAIQRIASLRHYRGTLYYLPAVEKPLNSEVGIEQLGDSPTTSDDPELHKDREPKNTDNIELLSKGEMSGPKCSIPSLLEPCGEEWKKIEDEFILLGIQSISHLGSDMHSAPGALFDDGHLDVQFIKKGTTKKTMMNLLVAFETGKHLESDDVTQLKVRAYRLVPGGEQPGHIAVDGEEIEYGTVQGEILPSLANIMMLKK